MSSFLDGKKLTTYTAQLFELPIFTSILAPQSPFLAPLVFHLQKPFKKNRSPPSDHPLPPGSLPIFQKLKILADGSKSQPKTGHAYSIHNYHFPSPKKFFLYSILKNSQPNWAPFTLDFHITCSTPSRSQIHHLVQRIHILLLILSSNITFSFIWFPGHIDLLDHDAVDQAAKNSILSPKIINTFLRNN